MLRHFLIEFFLFYEKKKIPKLQIEEQCISELSWKSDSALWDKIHQCGTTLPGQQLADMHVSPNKSPREAVSKQLFINDDAMSVPSTSINGGTSTCNSKSVLLFFRKFYRIAYLRILDLCQHLDYTDSKHLQKIWTIFENAITKQFHLMVSALNISLYSASTLPLR